MAIGDNGRLTADVLSAVEEEHRNDHASVTLHLRHTVVYTACWAMGAVTEIRKRTRDENVEPPHAQVCSSCIYFCKYRIITYKQNISKRFPKIDTCITVLPNVYQANWVASLLFTYVCSLELTVIKLFQKGTNHGFVSGAYWKNGRTGICSSHRPKIKQVNFNECMEMSVEIPYCFRPVFVTFNFFSS